jgi:hypothetical protein
MARKANDSSKLPTSKSSPLIINSDLKIDLEVDISFPHCTPTLESNYIVE